MISLQQIRAARALLDWKQADLAKASGLSLAAIAKLEQGLSVPRVTTMESIHAAFEKSGLEFTDDPGVRLHTEKFNVRMLDGAKAIPEVWRDIETTLENSDKRELLLSGVDENTWLKKYNKELKAMLVRHREKDISTRLLIREGDNVITAPLEHYRAIPKFLFQQTPYYVYGNKIAIINWGPPIQIILVESKAIAETFRRQFEFNWSNGKHLRKGDVVKVKIDP